jgi:predicted dehydrogenase
MKIGIVGLGYWGKIILNNLLDLGHKDVVLCDTKKVLSGLNLKKRFKYETSYERLRCDKVFVLTPVETHYKICNYFLNQGVDVFCEI